MDPRVPFIAIAGGLLALLPLWGAFRQLRKRRLLENIPTSKTTGVFIGLVELKGTAERSRPLVSYLAEQPCVLYDWTVSEHWSRTVTETYRDSDGKTKTRTRRESGWKQVASGGEMRSFHLQDDRGRIRVRPEGAKIEPVTLFDETCDLGDPLYHGKGPEESVPDSDHRRWFQETGIPLHAELYVMGHARERKDIVAAEIARDDGDPLFIISTRSEAKIRSGMNAGYLFLAVLGLLLAVAGFVIQDLALDREPAVRWPAYVLAAAGYVAAFALSWLWTVHNSLVDLRQRVRQAWSQVDVQLKRRHDLIPNLLAVIEGIRGHERELQSALALIRDQERATAPGVEGPDPRAFAPAVRSVVESYPEIRADANFEALRKTLVETEDRIALARGYFNDIATFYNTRLETVPDRYAARLAGMKPRPLMESNEFRQAPEAEEVGAEPVPS